MNRLITIVLLTVWSLVVFTSCGMELRHKGKVKADVDVAIKPDYEALYEACQKELGLDEVPDEELTDDERAEITDCAMDKYLQLLEALDEE